MFFTEQLGAIPHLLTGRVWSETVQKKLDREYLNLEATLLRAKVLRVLSQSKLIYLIQSSIENQSSDLAYLFTPFIFANLNKRTIYSTPATETVLSILTKYYQADKKPIINLEKALDDLCVYLDLSDINLGSEEFFYTCLMKALCRTDISTIFLMSDLEIDQEKIDTLAKFLDIDIFIISTKTQEKIIHSNVINMRKLLFKNKDEEYMKLCSLFSQKDAEIISKTETLNELQAKNFIEDMFYAEHIYEKISVYAEYVQTQIQHR